MKIFLKWFSIILLFLFGLYTLTFTYLNKVYNDFKEQAQIEAQYKINTNNYNSLKERDKLYKLNEIEITGNDIRLREMLESLSRMENKLENMKDIVDKYNDPENNYRYNFSSDIGE